MGHCDLEAHGLGSIDDRVFAAEHCGALEGRIRQSLECRVGSATRGRPSRFLCWRGGRGVVRGDGGLKLKGGR